MIIGVFYKGVSNIEQQLVKKIDRYKYTFILDKEKVDTFEVHYFNLSKRNLSKLADKFPTFDYIFVENSVESDDYFKIDEEFYPDVESVYDEGISLVKHLFNRYNETLKSYSHYLVEKSDYRIIFHKNITKLQLSVLQYEYPSKYFKKIFFSEDEAKAFINQDLDEHIDRYKMQIETAKNHINRLEKQKLNINVEN